jgi:hypothetical protein
MLRGPPLRLFRFWYGPLVTLPRDSDADLHRRKNCALTRWFKTARDVNSRLRNERDDMKTDFENVPLISRSSLLSPSCLREAGRTLAEALVPGLVIGLLIVGITSALAKGIRVVELTRDNVRDTEFIMQKAESLRLFDGSQAVSEKTCGGKPAAAGDTRLRELTVTRDRTNIQGTKSDVQGSRVQARLARNGAPKYVWPAL